jgi:hypothetical protein
LIELVQKGDLRTFPSKDPDAHAIQIAEIPEIDLSGNTAAYFIDRDDLGCFLVGRVHPLPRFWYEPGDEAIYENRIAAQAESVDAQREHLKAVVAENESLKRQLLDARPFMNPKHPHFAPELEAAVQLWVDLFSDKPADAPVAYTPTMGRWLRTNRLEAVRTKDGKVSNSAIERITTVANPRKEGGRPRKSRFS